VTSLEKTNYDERKEAILKQLFTAFNHNISNSILERHELLFAMRLAQIRLENDPDCVELFKIFLSSGEGN
jgi:hypothetical protein